MRFLRPVVRASRGICQQRRWNHSITPVERLVMGSIRATGPISFSTYMAFCLSHPVHGYYMNPNNPIFGSRGDFITSPEISQVFGELVAIWFLSHWQQTKPQADVRLVELGPGRGTLAQDMIRVMSRLGKSKLKSVHLVESSEALRKMQDARLAPIAKADGWELNWHDTIDDVPKQANEYTMVVAHEFFDALPIHLFTKTEDGWKEVMISSKTELLPSKDSEEGPAKSETHFTRVLPSGPTRTSEYLAQTSPRYADLPVGSSLEISPSGFRIAHKVAELLHAAEPSDAGGSALIIDYGDDKAFGDSIRAFKDHKLVDIFHQPGDCDITANVDFAYLKEACAGLVSTHGPLSQAEFLHQMGLGLRVAALCNAASSEERKEAIRSAAQRLVNPIGMGREYKVMGLTSQSSQVWPFVQDSSPSST